MPYTIRIVDRIEPTRIVQGLNGLEVFRNPEPLFTPPQNFVRKLWEEKSGIYADDPTQRVELWEDVNGIDTFAQITAACPGFIQSRLTLIKQNAKQIIEKKWPLWAQNNCALGLYSETTIAQCKADIAAVIAASNTAEDAVAAATSVDAVLSVTPAWPTL
jgi:hypothetical protein